MNKQIFLSSSFVDFNLERDLINSVVKSKVNDALGRLSCSFIDLRWGVDTSFETSETRMKKILYRCSEVVKSTKPYFILLLGDNYGTLLDKEDYDLFCKFNRLDPGNGPVSITELETMISGFYDERVKGGLYVVLKRNILNKDKLKDSKYIGQKNKKKLDEFVERVNNSRATEIKYDAIVDEDDNLSLVNQEQFANDICNVIVNTLKNEFGDDSNEESYDKQKRYFDEMEQRYLKETIGRVKILSSIVTSTLSNKITYISGDSGTGKTCLMMWAKDIILEISKCKCYSFYAGDTFLSPSDDTIIEYFAHTGGKNPHLINNYYTLFNSFEDDGEICFFVDASNEIQKTKLMSLDESFIPDNIHLIISTCDKIDKSIVIGDFEDDEAILAIKTACDIAQKEIDLRYFMLAKEEDYLSFKKLKKPLLLSLFVSSMLSLEKEDFAFIEKLRKIKGYDYDLSFLHLLNFKLYGLSEDVDEELLKRISTQENLMILAFIALSFSGLSLDMIKLYYKTLYDNDLDDLDFFNLQSRLSGFIRKDEEGFYSISHSSLKQLVLKRISKTRNNIIHIMQRALQQQQKGVIDFVVMSEACHLCYLDNNYKALADTAARLVVMDKRKSVYDPLTFDPSSPLQSSVNMSILFYKQTLESYKFDLFEKFIEMNNPHAVLFCYRYMLLSLSGIEQHQHLDMFEKALTQCLTINDESPEMMYDILGMLEIAVNDLLIYSRVEDALKLLNAHGSLAASIAYYIHCELGVTFFEMNSDIREQLINPFKYMAKHRYKTAREDGKVPYRDYYSVQGIVPFIAASPFVYNHFFSESELSDLMAYVIEYCDKTEGGLTGPVAFLHHIIFTTIIIELLPIKNYDYYYNKCMLMIYGNIKKCDFSLTNRYDNVLVFDFLLKHILKEKQNYKKLCLSIDRITDDIPTTHLSTCVNAIVWRAPDKGELKVLDSINKKYYSNFLNKRISTNTAQTFYISAVVVYLNSKNSNKDKSQLKKYIKCIFDNSPFDYEMAINIANQLSADQDKCIFNQNSIDDKKSYITDCLNGFLNI